MCCTIELLEPRRLLSSTLSATFVGAIPTSAMPQGQTHVTVRVADTGSTGVREPVRVSLFASPDAGIDGGAVPLGAKPLMVRTGVHRAATVRLAFSSPPSLGGGDYLLVARVDPTTTRTGDESAVAVAQKPTAFIQPVVDLTAQIVAQPSQAVFASPTQPGAGSVTVLVFNAGNTPAAGSLSVSVYASAEPTFKSSAPVIGQRALPRFVLRGGRSKAVSVPMTIPAGTAAGSYHLFAQINPSGGIVEINAANNIASTLTPLVVTNTPPAVPPGHHHGHHGGGYYDYGYGYAAADVAGVGVAVAADDGSSDWAAVPPDSGSSDDTSGDTGAPPADSSPTSEPTTQPGDNSGSDTGNSDSGSSGDASGSDFGGSGGGVGGDFGSSDSGGDSSSSDGSSDFIRFSRANLKPPRSAPSPHAAR